VTNHPTHPPAKLLTHQTTDEHNIQQPMTSLINHPTYRMFNLPTKQGSKQGRKKKSKQATKQP
jgi:hypothetical protein